MNWDCLPQLSFLLNICSVQRPLPARKLQIVKSLNSESEAEMTFFAKK